MPNWKKVILSGSDASLSNVSASGGISASYIQLGKGSFQASSEAEKTDVAAVLPIDSRIYTLDGSGAHLRNLIGKTSGKVIEIGQHTTYISGIKLNPGSNGSISFRSQSVEVASIDPYGTITGSRNLYSDDQGDNQAFRQRGGSLIQSYITDADYESNAFYNPETFNHFAGADKWAAISASNTYDNWTSTAHADGVGTLKASSSITGDPFRVGGKQYQPYFSQSVGDGTGDLDDIIIEIDHTNKRLRHVATVGMQFTHHNWRAKRVKIEVYLQDDEDWITILDTTDNPSTTVFSNIDGLAPGGVANHIEKVKFTLNDPQNSGKYLRISKIFGFDYIGSSNFETNNSTTLGDYYIGKHDDSAHYGTIFPAEDNTIDLGKAGTNRYANVYATTFHGDGSNLTGVDGFPFTGSAAILGNLDVTGSTSISGSLNIDGDLDFSNGSQSVIKTGTQQSYTLPEQGTRMRFLTLSTGNDNTTSVVCRVHLDSGENGYKQPIVLDITYKPQTTTSKPEIRRLDNYEFHRHSNDIIFTSDEAGTAGADSHIYFEKVNYGTGRPVNIRKVEEFQGTVTILDGSTTDTNGGTDETVKIGVFEDLSVTGSAIITENVTVTGSLIVSESITADTLTLLGLSLVDNNAAVISGSNIFGSDIDDFHQFTGSLDITGSVTAESLVSRHSITSSVGFRVGLSDRPLRLTGGSSGFSTQPTIDAPGHDKIVIGATNNLMLGNDKKIFFDNGILSSIGPVNGEPETILLEGNAGIILQSHPTDNTGFIELREHVTASGDIWVSGSDPNTHIYLNNNGNITASGHFRFGDDSSIRKPIEEDLSLEIRNSYGNSLIASASLKFGHGNGTSAGGKITSLREQNYVVGQSAHSALAFYTAYDGFDVEQLRISSDGNITASANISASGRVYGTHFGTGNANRNALDLGTDNTMQFRVNDGSRLTLTSTIFRPTSDEGVSLGRTAQKWKELVVNHITASGNVSGSGESTASFGTYFGDGSNLEGISGFPFTGSAIISGGLAITGALDISGSLTFDGNTTIGTAGASDSLTINPQGTLNIGTGQADSIQIGRQSGTTAGRVELYANSATKAAIFASESIQFNHAITASGKISASGLIHGNYLKSGHDITLGESNSEGTITFGNGSGAVLKQDGVSTFKITEGTIKLQGNGQVTSTLTVSGESLKHSTAGTKRPIHHFLWNEHADSVGDLVRHHPSSSIGLIQFGERAYDANGNGGVTTVTQSAAIEIFRSQERRTGGPLIGSPDPNFTYNAFGTEMHFRIMPSSSEGNVFQDVPDMTTALKLNAETGAHISGNINLSPSSTVRSSNPVIIFPASGTLLPNEIADLAHPIGENLNFGESERGTIVISSSFTNVAFNSTMDLTLGLFKTPVKNSRVNYTLDMEVYNMAEQSAFAFAQSRNQFSWFSGSHSVSGSAVTVDYTNADYGTDQYGNVYSKTNRYNLGKQQQVFHQHYNDRDDRIVLDIDHNHNDPNNDTLWVFDSNSNENTGESSWVKWYSSYSNSYLWYGGHNGERFRAIGPNTYNGEEYITAHWDTGHLPATEGWAGWGGLQFTVTINYEVFNSRKPSPFQ